MRIAFCSAMDGYGWGGSEELWSQSAVRLALEGHAIMASVNGWAEPRPKLEPLRKAGVLVNERPLTPVAFSQRAVMAMKRRLPGHDALGLAPIEKFRPDLVCISDGGISCGLGAMEWCSRKGIPFMSICHANNEAWQLNDVWVDQLRAAYGSARLCCFVSDANRRLLEIQLGERLKNWRVVRNPFGVAYDKPLAWPGDGPPWRLAYVGRVEPAIKGHDVLLQVLAGDRWKDRQIVLDIYGNGSMERSTERLARMLGLEGKVRFMGFHSAIEDIWNTHHGLVLTSRFEGLPLVVVEAMLSGRPVIATDVGGNREVIEDNVSGFISAAPAVDLVDGTMERAWERRADWSRMGEEAARRIRSLIPPDPIGDFIQLLQRVAKGELA